MKRLFAFALAIMMVVFSSVAFADIDISNLSYQELVSLVNEAQMLIMKTDEWQEVTVPEGLYQIGKDIPEGRWTITCPPKLYSISLMIGSKLYSDLLSVDFDKYVSLKGKNSMMFTQGDTTSITLDLKDGMYLQIQSGSAIFTPDKGNSFSFK